MDFYYYRVHPIIFDLFVFGFLLTEIIKLFLYYRCDWLLEVFSVRQDRSRLRSD